MDFQQTVKKLNQWTSPGILRYFQQDLIRENEWRWTIHTQEGRMILKSPIIPQTVFVTGKIGTGFKIEHYFRDEELVPIEITGVNKNIPENIFVSLASKLDRVGKVPSDVFTLLIGHPNFAHFLRDQLPALIKEESCISEKIRRSELRVAISEYHAQVLESFGGLRTLLPYLNVEGLGGPSKEFPNNMFSIGSRILSHEAHSRIKSHFIGDNNEESHKPKLVLSHRLDGRLPANVDDLYIEIAAKWITEKNGVVVLDGWNLTHQEARQDITKRVEAHSAYLKTLREACLERIPINKRFQFSTTSGMSLQESIQSMKDVVYHVTPWGTVHHKCAWVWNSERLVLLPPGNDLKYHQQNIRNHFEGSKKISFLPEHEFADESIGGSRSPFKKYQIVDVKSASTQILENF